jgi:hypothetical protein
MRREMSLRSRQGGYPDPRHIPLLALLTACLAAWLGCSAAVAAEQAQPTPTPTPAPHDQADQQKSPKSDTSNKTPAPKSTPATQTKRQEAPLTFTDEDLQKFHQAPPDEEEEGDDAAAEGGASATPPAARSATRPPTPAPKQPDPLKPFKDRERDREIRRQQIQGLRDTITRLQGRLDYLKNKRLAILDPLRVMPQPQSDDEKQQEAKLGAKDLLAQVDEEIKSVEAELKDAQESLVSIETRFGAQAGLDE